MGFSNRFFFLYVKSAVKEFTSAIFMLADLTFLKNPEVLANVKFQFMEKIKLYSIEM